MRSEFRRDCDSRIPLRCGGRPNNAVYRAYTAKISSLRALSECIAPLRDPMRLRYVVANERKSYRVKYTASEKFFSSHRRRVIYVCFSPAYTLRREKERKDIGRTTTRISSDRKMCCNANCSRVRSECAVVRARKT